LKPAIGNEILRENSNDNGVSLANLPHQKSVKNTTFPSDYLRNRSTKVTGQILSFGIPLTIFSFII